jgi:hypothetical protein
MNQILFVTCHTIIPLSALTTGRLCQRLIVDYERPTESDTGVRSVEVGKLEFDK